MCLFIEKNKNYKEPHVAKRDIVCYKYLYDYDGKIKAPYFSYIYDLRVVHKTHMSFFDYEKAELAYVESGFHSFSNRFSCIERLLKCTCRWLYKPYKCVIPKGATYYKGLNNELASDKIIVLSKIKINWFDKLVIYLMSEYREFREYLSYISRDFRNN